jgi:hypothetical protein
MSAHPFLLRLGEGSFPTILESGEEDPRWSIQGTQDADSLRLIEPLAIIQGLMGIRTWLSEVQYFMGKLKQRSFSGMPL